MSSELEPAKRAVKPLLYSREQFLVDSLEPASGSDRFDVIAKRIVRIEVDGHVWIKRGSLVSYRGDFALSPRESPLDLDKNAEDADHFISPEERLRVAMARQ